jgi:hypothetical protein
MKSVMDRWSILALFALALGHRLPERVARQPFTGPNART